MTYALDEGSGSNEQGLQQCCTVSTGVTVTYAASRLRFSMYRLITASSSFRSFLLSPSTKSIVFCQGLVTVFSAGIETAYFNAFASDHKLWVNCSCVRWSERLAHGLSSATIRSKPFILLQVASFSYARNSLIFSRRRAFTVLVTIASIRLRSFSCSDSKRTPNTSFWVYPFLSYQ